jgi:hypothetical protein
MSIFDKLRGKKDGGDISAAKTESEQSEGKTLFAWFNSEAFLAHQKYLNGVLAELPVCESPKSWRKKFSAAVGVIEYVGFSQNCDCLLTVSSTGSGLWDLSTGEKIAREYYKDALPHNGGFLVNPDLDARNLICRGIGPVAGEEIKIAGLDGGGLRTTSGKGESIVIVSPQYPCHEVVFEANFQSCFTPGKNQDCVIVYKGFVKPNMCGFSYSGDYFVVTDEDVHVWERIS